MPPVSELTLKGSGGSRRLARTLQDVIAELSHGVHRIITNPPTARNITEWCKAERCWEMVRTSVSRAPVDRIGDELLNAADDSKRAEALYIECLLGSCGESEEAGSGELGGLEDAGRLGNGDGIDKIPASGSWLSASAELSRGETA